MKVTLEKLKKIGKLEFDLPDRGVWLVTGLNGSGKTSLLAALFRIGSSHAFQRYYKTSSFEDKLDSFSDTKITYQINNEYVSYAYGGQRWRATPSRNSRLFTQFPYNSVKFVEANGSRVEPFADEIRPRSVRTAPEDVRMFMSFVLGDRKWENLKYVNTRRGVGSEAYLLPYASRGTTYYFSEKNFSLGELCVLRLACKLSNIQKKSLVLIDEVEMALHPQAQVRLLEKVKEISKEMQLTTLFSTHSATLIKNIERKNIILLQEQASKVFKSVQNVYPAQVLGEIAFDDEISADYIFLVEDKQAKMLLEQILAFYISETRATRNYSPMYKIVPIGGFVQVVELLNASSQIFPDYVKRYAFLDEDVKSESLTNAKKKGMQSLLDLFTQSNNNIKYLPCTPEVGLMEMIEGGSVDSVINSLFNGSTINIQRIIKSNDYTILNKSNIRDKAKDRINFIVEKISSSTGVMNNDIYKAFYKLYCEQKYGSSLSSLHQILAPILNAR
ncbi:AAA family ATPase [Vibrio cholerae]|uniref:AAA family ATPase n=1 Tax=Vibrio cholerae TaxID=666 RepID=UPI0008936804|nr:AAA family ATPase [Vibrio cholerae]ELV5030136.1 AAA family ATPase [Vibrio cholerae]OFJ23074.1 ATP-binding protein [Vibrio cholerae]